MIRATLEAISLWAIPVLLVFIPLVGMLRKVKVYDTFIDGAKEGFNVAVRIIPFLVGILVAIGMFRASGAMDMLTAALRPIAAATRFPADLIPLVVLRTLSGSGSLALTTDIIKRFGADSVMARTAATLYGSSETLFYVLDVALRHPKEFSEAYNEALNQVGLGLQRVRYDGARAIYQPPFFVQFAPQER